MDQSNHFIIRHRYSRQERRRITKSRIHWSIYLGFVIISSLALSNLLALNAPTVSPQEASNAEVSSVKDVPKIEQRLVESIAREGTDGRFLIPQIRPIGTSTVGGKICIIGQGKLPISRSANERLGEGTVLESIRPVRPGDIVNESKGTFGVLVGRNGLDANKASYSPGAIWKTIPNLVVGDEIDETRGVAFVSGIRLGCLYEGDGNLVFDYIKADDQILVCPAGSSGSIHRIIGRLGVGNYLFTGEKDVLYPLTFILTKEGYVYLRGRGTVKLANGETVQLGLTPEGVKKQPQSDAIILSRIKAEPGDGSNVKATLKAGMKATAEVYDTDNPTVRFTGAKLDQNAGDKLKVFVVSGATATLYQEVRGLGKVGLKVRGEFLVDEFLKVAGIGSWDGNKDGAVHTVLGKLTMFDYEFDSNETTPLKFKITKDGYVYLEGTGTVKDLKMGNKYKLLPVSLPKQETPVRTMDTTLPPALMLSRLVADAGELFDKQNLPKCSLSSVPVTDLPEKFTFDIRGFINWPKDYQPPKPSPYTNEDKEKIVAEGIFYTKVPSSTGEGGGFRCIGKFLVDKSLNPVDGIWDGKKEGAVHTIIGKLTMFDYYFQSDQASPLVFKVTENGYVYVEGKGMVTDRKNGEKYTLPK